MILQLEVEDNGSSIANLQHVFDAFLANDADELFPLLWRNAGAALHWLEGDPKDIARAASLIEILLRDGLSIGNVVHEMRKLFKAQSLNRTIVQPNELIHQVVVVVGRDLLGTGYRTLRRFGPTSSGGRSKCHSDPASSVKSASKRECVIHVSVRSA